jgi:phospholipid/cholesterol/gamma-HCH transport system substrate-binding protein
MPPDNGDAGRRPRNRYLTRVIIAAAALIGLGAFMFNSLSDRLWWLLHPGREYWSAFQSVAGLEPNDDVRYGGLPVGRVRTIKIDAAHPGRLLVRFRVESGIPIGPETRASILDITWPVSRYLSLRPDTQQLRELPPGSEIRTEPGATLETLAMDLAVTLDRTDTLLRTMGSVVDTEFIRHTANVVARLDTLSGTMARVVTRTRPMIEDAAQNMARVLARTDTLLAAVDSARPTLEAAPAAALATLEETRAILAQIRIAIDAGGGLTGLMQDLTTASAHLARLSMQLDRNPAGLLGGRATLPKRSGPKLHD